MSTLKKALSYSVVLTTIVWSVGLLTTPVAVGAASSGSLIKMACGTGASVSDPCRAVYYLGGDGKRYVFPNEKTFKTWYADFAGVQTVSSTEMSSYPIGGNVTYRPGVKLVKITTDPKVYAVAGNGTLRWVTTGEIATSLYGANWSKMVEDVADSFFVNYTMGADITAASQYDKAAQMADASSINDDKNLGGVVSGGSSLTVALASDTPASGVVVENAARVPFTKVNVTASADGDIVIDSMMVKRDGVASDAAFGSVDVLDGATMLPFNRTGKTFNSDHMASFSEDIVVKAGTTRSLILAGNFGSSLDAYAGEFPVLTLSSMTLSGGAKVVGSLPISGNFQNLNATITIGSAAVARGAYSNATNTSLEVGKTNYNMLSFSLQAGSSEDIEFRQVRVYEVGSANLGTDITNLRLFNDGTELAKGVVNGKYVDFTLAAPHNIPKGQVRQLVVKGDIADGSGRTIQLAIERTTDLLVRGLTYNYNITPSYSGTGSSSVTPVLTDNQHTVSNGTVTISKSNDVSSGNVSIGTNQWLGSFKFDVKGEPVEISQLVLTIASTSAANTESVVQSVRLVDASGKVLAGPADVAAGGSTVTFNDTISLPTGENVLRVQANLPISAGIATGDTITVSLQTAASATTIRGNTTGNTITASPASNITANVQTVKAAGLSVTRLGTPSTKTVVAGTVQEALGAWSFDATNSGEDVRITALAFAASTTNVNALTLYDGTKALSPVENAPSGCPCGNPRSSTATTTITLSEPIIVTKGTTKTLTLKGDISSAAASGEVVAFGLTSTSGVTAYGTSTGNAASVSVSADDGAVITFASAGTLTISTSNTPQKELILSGYTGYTVNSLKLSATNENLVLDELVIRFADGGETGTGTGETSDIANVAIYNGATKLMEASIPSTGARTFFFSQTPSDPSYVLIPKDGDITLTIKVDTAQITVQGTNNPGTPNADFILGIGGANGIKARGKDSGSVATETYNSSTSTAKVLMTAVPKVTLPTSSNRLGAASTLTNGDIRLFAFDVMADSAQNRPVMLYRTSFAVTTSSDVTVNTLYMKQEGVGEKVSSSDGSLTYSADGVGYVEFIFNSPTISEGDVGEQIEIAAGTTKRFYLNGTVANASSGETVTVSLLGDTASTINNNVTGQTAATWTGTDLGKFVWSDDHLNYAGSSDATQQAQWFNGNLVQGLEKTVTTTGYTISF